MGCGCQNNSPQQEYVVAFGDGTTGTFDTPLGAQMAIAKKGKGGTVTTKAKSTTGS